MHAVQACGGRWQHESSRRHNKFKREMRARPAPTSVSPCRGRGATTGAPRPSRATGRQRRYHGRSSSKQSDGPSAWGSDAAKRGVGARVTRGRGSGAGEGLGGEGGPSTEGEGGSWDECARQAGRTSAGRQSASARFVPPLFADRTSLRLILSRRAPAVVADAAARTQGHLARRGELQWGDRAARVQLAPRALGSTVDAGSVRSKHACTPRAAHLSQLGPPWASLSARTNARAMGRWLGRHGIAEAHASQGLKMRVLLWCGGSWAHRLDCCRPVSGACR